MASYNITHPIDKKGQSYTIEEELIIPSVREVIETVIKEDSSYVQKCLSLSNGNDQHHIVEMSLDMRKTLNSEL